MNLMDLVQILILLVLLLLLLKPLYARYLPEQWRGILQRILPPRSLKYEGTWQRNSSDPDADK